MKKSWIVIAAAIGLVVIASVAVLKTSGDDSRRQGALGGDEPVTLSWYGDWNAEKAYAPGSVVTHDGGSYIAETEKLSTPEPGCTDCGWTQMAAESPPTETKEGSTAQMSGYEIIKGDLVVATGSSTGQTTVNCPAGKKVFGGGALATGLVFSGPVGPGTPFENNGVYGWKFGARYEGGGLTLYVFAVCAYAS